MSLIHIRLTCVCLGYLSDLHVLIKHAITSTSHTANCCSILSVFLLQRSWTYHCEGILPRLWRALGYSFTCNRGHMYYMSSAT